MARLEPRWESELSDVEFAVQEVPDPDTIGEEGVPLARIVRGSSRATASRTRSSNCCARLRYSGTPGGTSLPRSPRP